MKKIKSLFKRNYDGDRLVYNEVVEGSEWVIAGEGIATVKIDGTSCLVREGKLYKRFDRKQGKAAPEGWIAAEKQPDEHTGHWPGWVPVSDTAPEDRWHIEAWNNLMNETVRIDELFMDGTYELIGEKVQGNPYKLYGHSLVRHGVSKFHDDPPRDFDGLKAWFETHNVEGIVWHRGNGDMVKIKRRDFGLEWNGRK